MCGGAGHVASQHAMRPRSDIAYPSMPCGPHRGEPCPGMPCGPPTEESHVPACCAATQRGTSHRAASPPGLSWSLQQFKAGILCLIPPPPSGEVQHSSLGLGAARTGRCLRGAARGFTWVSREMEATLPAVAEELLKEIQKAFQETAHVPDDLLLALKFVFGSSAVAALDLVDQHSVTRIVSSSGRAVYQVLGSSGKLYTCYASCHFCTCPAFAFSVLRKNDSLVCKHILAMYLSQATGACQELSVSDQQLASILLAEEEEEGRRTLDHVLTPSLLQRLPGSSERNTIVAKTRFNQSPLASAWKRMENVLTA
ncbi:zinc finger SWIM domain-containing protein 7 isoform X2 [Chelonia mydas]|uniref:zinc finger SWIM domain-containing protein 7 isoform X2 n=1 Tax=Chelonia mydas TaxID=8469 RepID=UPI001CA99016|nr:zinc finger SWIM domain-containing protein 7 isoform X2 [Chelonia mydas]